MSGVWNASMLLMWLMGVSVVAVGAYYACRVERSALTTRQDAFHPSAKIAIDERNSSSENKSGYGSIDEVLKDVEVSPESTDHIVLDSEGEPHFRLSSRHAIYFLLAASGTLLLLYYVNLLVLVNLLFVMGATIALTNVVVLPVCYKLFRLRPHLDDRSYLLVLGLSSLVSLSIVVMWYWHRDSSYGWVLQDILCATLCLTVLDWLQLASLRVAFSLLLTAFAYDIFFVYVSPYIFGSNVMVDVATGNNRMDTEHNTTHDGVPMLFTVPVLFSPEPRRSILGMGDIALPGLLVAFCLRFDYALQSHQFKRKHKVDYFAVALATYAVGLLLANVMTILLRDVVSGQPALLYIVPLMLGGVSLVAKSQRHFHVMWDGIDALDAPHEWDSAESEMISILAK